MKLTSPPVTQAPPHPTTATAVAVGGLTYSYGERRALDGLSLEVPAGSIFGLLGPNGAGKSTLLSLLIGRREPAAGSIDILGDAPGPRVRERMAMVFQEPSLDPSMTVRETMHLQGRMFGLSRNVIGPESEALLERVNLLDRASSPTATLSGGMKRRLELARALLTHPALILLDEPTLALDPDSRLALWGHLIDSNQAGCTLLLATNDVYEAERYCQRVALIAEGRLVAEGAPADLKRDLRRDAVRVEWKSPPQPDAVTSIEGWPGVGTVRLAGHTTHITVDSASPFLSRLFLEYGDLVHGIQVEESTLEDVYFHLVGRGISGAHASEED